MSSIPSLRPIVHTLFSATAGPLVGLSAGHLYATFNGMRSKRGPISHLSGYALAGLTSYITARFCIPSFIASDSPHEHLAISIASLITASFFFDKRDRPQYIGMAALAPVVTSVLMPRPLATAASSLAISATNYYILSQGTEHPSQETQEKPHHKTDRSSYEICADLFGIALLSAIGAVEGTMAR